MIDDHKAISQGDRALTFREARDTVRNSRTQDCATTARSGHLIFLNSAEQYLFRSAVWSSSWNVIASLPPILQKGR